MIGQNNNNNTNNQSLNNKNTSSKSIPSNKTTNIYLNNTSKILSFNSPIIFYGKRNTSKDIVYFPLFIN